MNPLEDPIDAYGASNSLTRGLSTTSKRSVHGSGQPEGWIFDADIPSNNASTLMVNRNGSAFDGSKLFNGTINDSSEGLRVGGQQRRKRNVFSFKKSWKWPWEKDKVLMGERIIFLNDEGANADSGFVSNYVSTSKYNMVTFLPKFLYGMSYLILRCCVAHHISEQFSKYANVFFLFTGMATSIRLTKCS
jgi:phospholipid-transporting ATPase